MAGYWLLFFWSFLSATIIPLGSEPYFVMMVMENQDWVLPSIVATIGNTLGSMTILWLGRIGNQWIHQKLEGKNVSLYTKTEMFVDKYGLPVLLLAWLPIVGDILVLMISLTAPSMTKAVIFLFLGKGFRYILLALTSLSII